MTHEEEPAQARAGGRSSRRRGWALKVVLPSAIALVAGTAVAVGFPTGGGGVITACVNTNVSDEQPLGMVRVIDTASTATATDGYGFAAGSCNSTDETSITWNQQGPAGVTGPQGATGPAGATGSQGATGATGAQGAAGANGGEGPQGPAGADGTSSGPSSGFPAGERAYVQFTAGKQGSPPLQGESQVTIQGEPPSEQAVAPIEVSDFSFDISQSLNIGSQSSGAGAGKVTFNPFSITRRLDRNSPPLFTAAAAGQPFAQVWLTIVRTGEGAKVQPIEQFRFKLVAVKSIAYSPGQEVDSFEYGGLQVLYYQQSRGAGNLGVPVAGGWNRVTNSSDPVVGISKVH